MRRAMLVLACALAYAAHAETNSEKYRGLIEDNQARLRFTDAQNLKLGREFRASRVYARVRQDLQTFFAGPTTRQTLTLDDRRELQWIDRGLGLTSEVVLVDRQGDLPPATLYQTFSQQIGQAAVITNLQVSPDAKHLLIVVAKYGSIDHQEGLVLSLQSRREIARVPLYFDNAVWVAPTRFLYARMSDDGEFAYALFDAATGESRATKLTAQSQSRDFALVRELDGAKRLLLVEKKTGAQRAIPADLGRLVGNDGTRAYFLKDGQLLQYVNAGGEPTVLVKETKLRLGTPFVDEDGVFLPARDRRGRELRVYQPSTGRLLATLAVPECCAIRGVKWREPLRSLDVTLTSAAQAKVTVTHDLNAWPGDLEARMQALDGVTFKNELIEAKSVDGTPVPTRLTYRADLAHDGARPVLIKAYGGFNLPGYFDPSFDRSIAEFIKRGGIFVGPAVRGGGEFDGKWHEAAMKENKRRTFEDVDAVARRLVKDGWTTARKIAVQGTSNGGLTAAATALLYPNDFGLSIPIAGVLDLLGKDKLDASNDGWSEEYGPATAAYIPKWSPLELTARAKDVRFLIVDGATDTRVNPAHSVKLAKALFDQGATVSLLTVANGGHHAQSVGTNGSIGLIVQTAIWTTIYERLFDGSY